MGWRSKGGRVYNFSSIKIWGAYVFELFAGVLALTENREFIGC